MIYEARIFHFQCEFCYYCSFTAPFLWAKLPWSLVFQHTKCVIKVIKMCDKWILLAEYTRKVVRYAENTQLIDEIGCFEVGIWFWAAISVAIIDQFPRTNALMQDHRFSKNKCTNAQKTGIYCRLA